jgi:hypothetical protein
VKTARLLSTTPAAQPVLADDVLEFHAARLLLLLRHCGISNRIDGLTKLAKLDFFVRYPQFFAAISAKLGKSTQPPKRDIESSMVPVEESLRQHALFFPPPLDRELLAADRALDLRARILREQLFELFLDVFLCEVVSQ